MGAPLTPQQRSDILADILTGQLSRNEIARKHHVSAGSVTNIATAAGHTGAFDRSRTKNATDAAQADNKARRVRIAKRLLDRAEEALEQMDQPHMVMKIGGKDNVFTQQEVPVPPTADMRNLVIIAATCIDKHLVLERHDTDDLNLAGVDAWLRAMMYGEVPTDPARD